LGVLRRELKKRGDATRGGDDESSNAMEDGVNEVSAVLHDSPGQESSILTPFLEDFIAFDAVNDDDQELESLDR
jgi:hypothetical protein